MRRPVHSGKARNGKARARAPRRLLPGLLLALATACTPQPPAEQQRPNAEVTSTQPSPRKQPAAAPATGTAGAAELLAPATTYAVISGVLSWQDPALASFSAAQRKDQALFDKLRARGVPGDQLRLLLDAEASRANIMAATKAMAAAAPKGATLLFYYAGHGVKADDGKAYFACHDMQSKRSAETGLSLDALADTIAGSFKGKRVVLLADCCYSGSLAAVAKRLAAKGIEAVSLTSADESNVSTGNWTFTMSLLSCLGGDPLCDADGDGTIALAELASEVEASMKYREGQRYGFARHGVSEAIAVTRRVNKAALPPKQRRRYLNVRLEGRWQPARLRKQQAKQRTVRLFRYADHHDVAVAAGNTRKLAFKRYPAGSALKVFWGGKLWDAKVLRTDGDFHFITYPGWPAYWNEWVTSQRIASAGGAGDSAASGQDTADGDAASGDGGEAFAVGAAVQVEWHGQWYPAKVLARRGRRHRIHYDGYDDSWDEWVGPRRIRKPQ